MSTEEYLTGEEVRVMLKLPSMASLYSLRYRSGAPPGIRIGRKLMFRKSDIEQWWDQQLREQKTG
jgi:predicted DNA-binding transcriptional regulator AlpA